MPRDIHGEIREIVESHMLSGSPLGSALAAVADAVAAQDRGIGILTERVERLEHEVLPRTPGLAA